MKIFSLPILLVGAAVVVIGGVIFAMSVSSNAAHSKAIVAASPPAPAPVPATEEPATSSADNTASAPAVSTNASASTPPQSTAMAPLDNSGQNGVPNGEHRGGGQRMQQMLAQLGLTPDQQQQIQQIRSTITDRQQRRAAIMQVLTPDQQAKFQELRAQMRAQRGNGPGPGGPGGGGASGQ